MVSLPSLVVLGVLVLEQLDSSPMPASVATESAAAFPGDFIVGSFRLHIFVWVVPAVLPQARSGFSGG